MPHKFSVRLHGKRVQKELDSVNQPDYRRILGALKALAANPRPNGCYKLFDNIYRVRVGNWRIIYLVNDNGETVEVGSVRRRSERTYKNIEELFE